MAQFQKLVDRHKIPLQDIQQATNTFAKDNLIASGGFGSVYKGQLPHSTSSGEPSTTIAVKRLEKNNKYGQGQKQFATEINMLANYKHSNLVSFIGYCDDGGEKILVYKYETNGSLDKHLASTRLTWEQRLRICIGAARGLEYLHGGVGSSHRVLHRDIKSSNILLDENWEAKISDFGLSRLGPMNQEFTCLFTNALGTPGYVDPQYQKTGVLSKESDVYSFGVVMFEVLCGRVAFIHGYNDERKFLCEFVKRSYEEGKIDEIIMADLREQINKYSLQIFTRVAYECLSESRHERPSMRYIVQQLQSIESQIGSQTGLWGSSTGGTPWSLLLDNNMKLRKITIDHEDWIFSIGFTVEDLSGSLISSQYGGTGGPSGGELSEISFDKDEEITEILGTVGATQGRQFTVISSLCVVTNKRRHGRFGKEAGTCFSVSWNAGLFAGFYGRAGYYLDGLGFYSNKGSPTGLWGSITGGSSWSLLLDNNQKIRKIMIDHKDWIFSLGFTIEDLSGSLISFKHGGTGDASGGELSEINFDADEEIIEILGTVGITDGLYYTPMTVISSLCIVTNKRRHGRFGKETGTCFSVSWNAGMFAGFYGRAGFYLDGLGFYSN